MTIEKLERVMWRVRKYEPNNKHPYRSTYRRAIMFECGTSPATIKNNIKALKELKWIKQYGPSRQRYTLTNNDLNES